MLVQITKRERLAHLCYLQTYSLHSTNRSRQGFLYEMLLNNIFKNITIKRNVENLTCHLADLLLLTTHR